VIINVFFPGGSIKHSISVFTLAGIIALTVGCGTKVSSDSSSGLNAASDGSQLDWIDSMTLLKGYDVVSGLTRGDCVSPGDLDNGTEGANGNKGLWQIDFISDTAQLQKSLDVSASASLGQAVGASASVKARYSNSLRLNSYSVYAVASVQIEKSATNYNNVQLKQTYVDLINRVDPNKMKTFRTRCGDKYVAGQKTGGEYAAIIEIRTSSREEQTNASASVKAKSGPYSGSGSFVSALNELNSKYEMKMTTLKIGGSNDPVPTDPAGIIARAAGFEKEVDARSVPYKALLADYETLENFPFELPIVTESAINVIETLNKSRLLIDTTRANIEYVLANQSQFTNVKGEELSQKLNVLNDAENKLLDAARACAKNIDNCALPTNLGDISVKLPDWRDTSKPAQIFGPHESCGVESYNTSVGEVCGIESIEWNEGSDPVCGVKDITYNTGRADVCGIERYNSGAGSVCGAKTVETTVGDSFRNAEYNACVQAGGKQTYQDLPPCPYEGLGCASWPMARKTSCTLDNTCEHPSFGVASYNSCRNPAFGIESTTYNTCKDSKFGARTTTYKQCSNPVFGVKSYKSCMHAP
jgi:hypothetical protein